MKIARRCEWRVSPARAREIQAALAGEIIKTGEVPHPRLIAGADISVDRATGTGRAAVVVLSYPDMALRETALAEGRIEFPYVPGLLSFREAPLILAACEKLSLTPDVFIVDGQGYAHPRRMGLACHVGFCLGIPTIGVAKSRLIGEHDVPAPEAGSHSDLLDGGEVIGAALRTRERVRPVYVSIGHLISLEAAVRLVLACCRGYRLPEPSRLAHMAASSHTSFPRRRESKGGEGRYVVSS